jgi:Fe-S cluster assembly ATPase SufC
MSEKRLDAKNRWRNVVVAFRMSPEEAQELNVKVSLSGLSKQDYIIQCLLKHEIRVVGGMKVAKKVQVHLDTILEELQTLDESDRGIDVDAAYAVQRDWGNYQRYLKELEERGIHPDQQNLFA